MRTLPQSLRVTEGAPARLLCGADGNPAPRYMWSCMSDECLVTVAETLDLVFVVQYMCEVRVDDNRITSDMVCIDTQC